MGFWQNIFYNKSIRRLRQMLETVRMQDFSLQFNLKKLSGEERLMAEEINAVIREFREAEHKRESESHFYNALLSEVSSILIATDGKGNVRWMNKAAIDSLCGFRLETIDQLSALHPSLPGQIKKIRGGASQLVVFTTPNGEERQYATVLTKIFVRGVGYDLYTMQSVAPILRQGEMMIQERLIRVLTHEIMNSLAPIVSLSDTLAENFKNTENPNLTEEEVNQALSVIRRRANGLMSFVKRYRELSGIALPDIQMVKLKELVQDLQSLIVSQSTDTCNIDLEVRCTDRFVGMDRAQIEQVFINLLKNAMETKANHIRVIVSVSEDERWFMIIVEDNGGGFSAEVSDTLFAPFFTTKKGGQGIGLAVCRQIVSNHGGMIAAECIDGNIGARFTMRLPMSR